MTSLSYYARLVNLQTGAVLATTTSILAWSIARELDKVSDRSITVALGDPGAGTDVASGFAACALAATGGADATSVPVPTLCEFSLDGGATIDARFTVEQTVPNVAAGTATLQLSGPAPGALYGGSGPDRFPARDIALADVLGGSLGNVIPVDAAHYGISSGSGLGKLPGFQGLLNTVPGSENTASGTLWEATARARYAVTGVVSNALAGAIAGLGVNIDAWEDTTLRLITSVVSLLGGVLFSGDAQEQGSRGHAVWCDSDYNLSADSEGVVCDGTPHAADTPAWHGTNGYSNDATNHPAGIPNALVVGNVGGNPQGHAFLFDGTSTLPLDPAREQNRARVQPDQTQLTPDLSPLMREVRLTGGNSDAGLPANATLTAIITLNNQRTGSEPWYHWQDVLPIVAANQGTTTGMLYADVGDGRLRPLPCYNLALPIADMVVDNTAGNLYVATTHGVWSHDSSTLLSGAAPFVPVGGLESAVTRLSWDGASSTLLALVTGVDKEHDGLYQYNATTPYSNTGDGHDHWARVSSKEKLIDALHTDATSFFYLDSTGSGAALWYHDGTTPAVADKSWTLGSGVQGTRLDRVILAGGGGQDSVWVACAGGTQAAQYLVHGADWISQSLLPADHDGSLAAAVGAAMGSAGPPQVNRAVPLGYGINSTTIAVVLCTQVGLYYIPGATLPTTLGGAGWVGQLNGQNGLAGIALTHLVAGQQTSIPDPTNPSSHVNAARMYAIGGSTLFYSYSDGRYWRDLLRDPLTLGPFFFAAAQEELGALPDWGVQTLGPMAASPIGGPTASHVQLTHADTMLPTGWYWRRAFGPTYEPYYALVNGNVPWPTVYTEQVSEAAVSATVDMLAASAQLATFALMLLGEHSQQQVSLSMTSTFSQQESGLRYLWPSHAATVSQQGTIRQVSETGHLIGTQYITLVNAPFYVLSHTLSGDGPLVTCKTVMSPSIRGAPKSGSDFAAALIQNLRIIRLHGVRRR